MTAQTRFRLEGLEPDNLLAFLALLGLLRALEASDGTRAAPERLYPRASWDVDAPPLRPVLHLRQATTRAALIDAVAAGVTSLSAVYEFEGREKLKFTPDEVRPIMQSAVLADSIADRRRSDLWAALVLDGAGEEAAARTPLCLLDVARTSFLKNLRQVCAPLPASKRGTAPATMATHLESALFQPWTREDGTPSFRWDPVEDSRHAYRWSAPTDDKQGVQHGANILAAVALPLFTIVPATLGRRSRVLVVGGEWRSGGGDDTGFSIAWPIWRDPASLSAIRSLLTHPQLRRSGALAHLGVDHVVVARRVSAGKYMAFTRAVPVEPRPVA